MNMRSPGELWCRRWLKHIPLKAVHGSMDPTPRRCGLIIGMQVDAMDHLL